MNIIYKTIIFMAMTMLTMLLVAYFVYHTLGIVDRGIATFVAVVLLCIYMAGFMFINDKTMWLKV